MDAPMPPTQSSILGAIQKGHTHCPRNMSGQFDDSDVQWKNVSAKNKGPQNRAISQQPS
jgi:hypothetical protein